MPHNLDWYLPGRVLYGVVWGNLSADDGRRVNDDLGRFLAEDRARHPVHLIFDDGDIGIIPVNAALYREVLHTFSDAKLGWLLLVGNANMLTRLGAYLVSRIFRLRMERFRTRPEAFSFLKKVDPTLDWDSADETVFERISSGASNVS